MHDEIYLYWLSTLYKLGSQKQNQLLEHFGSARAAFDAPAELLRMIPGFTDHNVSTVLQDRDMRKVDAALRGMERLGIRYLSRRHEDFPALLAAIPDPPVGLFCAGKLPDPGTPAVSVIGSRRGTDYGLQVAEYFSRELAKNGVNIISGMARGIDSRAHQGALKAGGYTAAVFATGVDVCYPAENRGLRADIIRSGCVVSEYPPGVPAKPHQFPARNRIISGLSHVLLVVEAGSRSGTLITVEQALDQGREVMAVPGNVTNQYCMGTNTLLKEGAAPASCYEDVLHMLGMQVKNQMKNQANSRVKNQAKNRAGNPSPPSAPTAPATSATSTPNHIAPEEKLVYDVLHSGPCAFDDIVIKVQSPAHSVQAVLTMLEIKGYVQKLPGMQYARAK